MSQLTKSSVREKNANHGNQMKVAIDTTYKTRDQDLSELTQKPNFLKTMMMSQAETFSTTFASKPYS